jgi:NADPH:quinone reductase-like Zn-dependent oxidoreductase
MKAVQLQQFGAPEVLQYVSLPDPQPGSGEILLKVEAAAVNYSDIARRNNAIYPFPTPLPFIPGSEVAGTVAALGDGVDGPPLGTSVFALAGQGSGGYADYVATPAAQVIPMPPGISMDDAVSLPVAGTTAMLLIREVANLQPGETIFIPAAAGGVGSFLVQLAKLHKAGCVIGAASPSKFETVRALGADHVVDYTQADWAVQVNQLTQGRGVDVLLEMSGGSSFAQGLRCLAPFGRVVIYGMSSGTPLDFDAQSIEHFFYRPSLNQSIHVLNLGLWFGMRPQLAGKAMGDMIGLVASGQIKAPTPMLLPLSQAAAAHRLMESRQSTGKLVLKPSL